MTKKHKQVLKILSTEGLKVSDTALFEFQVVLRARGRNPVELSTAMKALKHIFESRKIKEASTMSTDLFIKQTEIEEKYGLSYFDSLIAASALAVDSRIVSDDTAFDRVPGLSRIPLR